MTGTRLRQRVTIYVALVAVVVAAWWALTATGAVKPILLAAPADVWDSLVNLLRTPSAILEPVGITVFETVVAFVIAVASALAIGLLVGASRLLVRAYEPVFTSVNSVPLVVLYPAIAAIVGIGSSSKIVLGCLYAFFPVVIAAVRAAATVDNRLLIAAHAMGATRRQRIVAVVLPGIVAPVIGSMRVAAGLALVTIIAGEFISGYQGVGYELGAASQSLDTPGLFAWVVLACVLTIAVNVAFTVVTNTIKKGVFR